MHRGLPDDRNIGARVVLKDVQRTFESRAYGSERPVVERLSLSIAPGEFVSLLGPSGCGKSTLLRLIADLDRPNSGTIAIDSFGRPFFRGFVFQEAALLPWKTVLENASLPLELTGVERRQASEIAREALVKIGLGDALEKFPNQLSGGMKMRVSVARALVGKPSLLLLDEPFAALDENTRHRLQEELRALWETLGMTVVFVTHSVSEAVYLSNRAVVLSKRPARILLDYAIDLPNPRIGRRIRTDVAFAREVDRIQDAFLTDAFQEESEA